MIIFHVLTRLLKAGSEENTLESCRHQVDNGCRVVIVYGCDSNADVLKKTQEIGCECIRVAEMVYEIDPVNDVKAILKIRELIKSIEPDIIHTHQSKAGILGRLASIGTKCGVVHSIHIVPFEHVSSVRKWGYILAEKFCARFTNQFINVSNGTKEIYLRHSIGAESKHQVIYSGMDVNKFAKKASSGVTNGAPIGTENPHRFNVVMLASFEDRKRQAPLIRALGSGLANYPNIHFYFCGEGETLEGCRSLVEELGLSSQITFTGFVNHPETYVKLAHLGILVSEREGLPRVLVQFLAAGAPVLTTWLQGIEEIVEQNVNGLISKPDDIPGLVQQIYDLSENEKSYNTLRKGAELFSADRWDRSRMGPAIIEVYQNALTA